MDDDKIVKLLFTAEEITKRSKEKDGEIVFIKSGEKCDENQEPYGKLLQEKLSSLTGGVFKIVDPVKKSGSKNRRVYVICDCIKDVKGKVDRAKSVRMPISYQISQHKLNHPLEMTWEILCKTCKKIDNELPVLQPENPSVPENSQESPAVVEELSDFDRATRIFKSGFDNYCTMFFNDCKNTSNPYETLIQSRTSFMIGLRGSLAASYDSLEKNDHLARPLNSGTPPTKQVEHPTAAVDGQQSNLNQMGFKRPLFLSPRALQAIKDQNGNIAKKSKEA